MPKHQTLQLPQGPIQYAEQGQGQPLVFVHGLMVDHRLWLPVMRALGPSVRCIAPDWPLGAHAQPMAPQADLTVRGMARLIADFIAALDLHDVTLVGNDTGGALVQMVCAHHPERIARMVLTTCDAYEVFPPPAFTYMKWLGRSPMGVWLAAQSLHHLPPLRRLPFTFGDLTEAPLDKELIEHWLTPLRTQAGVRRDVCQFLRTISTTDTLEAADTLGHGDMPTLLLWSNRCRHFPPSLAMRLQQSLRHTELHWLDSAGVFLSLSHPQAVAARVARFVATGGGPSVVEARRQG